MDYPNIVPDRRPPAPPSSCIDEASSLLLSSTRPNFVPQSSRNISPVLSSTSHPPLPNESSPYAWMVKRTVVQIIICIFSDIIETWCCMVEDPSRSAGQSR